MKNKIDDLMNQKIDSNKLNVYPKYLTSTNRIKPTMTTTKEMEERFDKTFREPPNSDIGWIVKLNDVFSETVTNKTLKIKLKAFIQSEISQALQEYGERVEKECRGLMDWDKWLEINRKFGIKLDEDGKPLKSLNEEMLNKEEK